MRGREIREEMIRKAEKMKKVFLYFIAFIFWLFWFLGRCWYLK